MKTEFSEKAFESELCELSNLFQSDGNMKDLFDWYDSAEHNWKYGSQSKFLRWVEKEEKTRAEKNNEKPLSIDAIRKQYQRNQKLPPEQRAFRLKRRKKIKEKAENIFKESLIASSYKSYAANEDYGGIFLPESSKKAIREIFEVARRKINMTLEKSRQYILNTTLVSAYGIWINNDILESLRTYHTDPHLGEILLEFSLGETKLEMGQGVFFVFADSQMVKNAKSLGKGYEHIEKKREELINSGILEEQDLFYIFKKNYAFSSPSIAASVLLGMNVNGQIVWRDHRGRTFKELHPKFDKIKRGPGRPKKFS